MNTTPWGFLLNGAAAVLVSTLRGVGWFDATHNEIHLADFSTVPAPSIHEMRPASVVETTLYYSLRHETRKARIEDYDRLARRAGGWTGD